MSSFNIYNNYSPSFYLFYNFTGLFALGSAEFCYISDGCKNIHSYEENMMRGKSSLKQWWCNILGLNASLSASSNPAWAS